MPHDWFVVDALTQHTIPTMKTMDAVNLYKSSDATYLSIKGSTRPKWELYRYAAQLQDLLTKACPGNKKAQELFDKWVGKLSPRWADPVTNSKDKTTDFTAPFFDENSYVAGRPGAPFVFMHEFMHLTDSNIAKGRSTSIGEYIVAFNNGTSNDLPGEKHADQLVRDLMNGKCPCD